MTKLAIIVAGLGVAIFGVAIASASLWRDGDGDKALIFGLITVFGLEAIVCALILL